MTTARVYAKPDGQLDTLVARTLRNAKAAIAAQGPRPHLPYRHADLFREPAYTDGQPYARDEDDDGE